MKILVFCLIILSSWISLSVGIDCSVFEPPKPVVKSPVLDSVAPILSPDFNTFTWTRSDLGECTGLVDEFYEVMIAGKDSTVPINGIPLCGVSDTDSCFITDFSQLQDGQDYKWSVKLTLNVTSSRAIMETETPGFFQWCEPAAPLEPVITGPADNTTFKHSETITFKWDPIVSFGKSCKSTSNVINFYLSRATTSLGGSVFKRPSSGSNFTYDTLLYPALDQGQWYWSIEASNLVSGTASLVKYFNVLPPEPKLCVPECSVGKGACNTTRGLCICSPGFTGNDCSQEISGTETPAPTQAPSNPGPLIGGLVAAFLIVLLIVAFLVFYYRREMQKRKDMEMQTILIEPPDFVALAFQPYQVAPSAFGEANSKKVHWKSFENLVLSDDFGLVLSILQSARMVHLDNLCTWLAIVFENQKMGAQLVQTLMLRELEDFEKQKDTNSNLESNPMPYRGDSAATKAFKVYTRLIGLPYLFETLGQILNDFCALLDEAEKNKENQADDDKTNETSVSTNTNTSTANLRKGNFSHMSMEVDPKRMNSEDDETINRLALQLICQKLFVKIFRSVNLFPVEIRVICKKVREESKKKESLQNVNLNVLLSNLVFLRFVNPAILVPHQCGIIKEEPEKGTQRQLVLITKVLQNLAAGVEFGKKEAFMTKLNDFIKANSNQMNAFLNELTENIPTSNSPGVAVYSTPISSSILNSSLSGLYEYVFSNQELILAGVQRIVSTRTAAQIEEKLQEVLKEIGDPANFKGK